MSNIRFFLTSRSLSMIAIITLFLFFISGYTFFLLYLLILLIFLFFHRKNPSIIFERKQNSSQLVYSPVNGVIEAITAEGIIIKTSSFLECGIYSPFKCEVEEYKKTNTFEILLKNDKQNKLKINFLKSTINIKPNLWVENKDRAKCGASIGFRFLGGNILINPIGEFEIVTKIGHRVEASQTIIAHFKESNE